MRKRDFTLCMCVNCFFINYCDDDDDDKVHCHSTCDYCLVRTCLFAYDEYSLCVSLNFVYQNCMMIITVLLPSSEARKKTFLI